MQCMVGASDAAVNLSNVDHVQTVVTGVPPNQPTTATPSAYDYYPHPMGRCPICGDSISGICIIVIIHSGITVGEQDKGEGDRVAFPQIRCITQFESLLLLS